MDVTRVSITGTGTSFNNQAVIFIASTVLAFYFSKVSQRATVVISSSGQVSEVTPQGRIG